MPPSKEALGIIEWLMRAGVPFQVTSKFPATPGVHSKTSYHYQRGTDGDSLAVDFDSIPAGSIAELQRIHDAFIPIRPLLAELLGPGDKDHDDHVHVAVPKGTFLVPFPKEAVPVADNPALPNITGPATFHPISDSNGVCTGYYIFSTETAEVHAYGDPTKVKYHGRSEVLPS